MPLSLFCPEACGCYRGDEDCPLACPERDETTPTCPAHQARTFVMEGKEALDWGQGYHCPRRPQTISFDVGEKGMLADEIRTILSPPPPPSNCAAASTGACRENGRVDADCCTYCGEGSCAPGYAYAGQFVFDKELLASTYPDFNPLCIVGCGNTCCVPSDEWDSAISSYTHLPMACVENHNIQLYKDKSVAECAAICDATPSCLAFEYGVDYGGGSDKYEPRDCQPQNSADSSGCRAEYWNLDLYVKETPALTRAYSYSYVNEAATPTAAGE